MKKYKRLLLDENIDQGGHFFRERNKVAQNKKKYYLDFVFQKCMAHFEAFRSYC